MQEEQLIFTVPPFSVFHRPDKDTENWMNLLLVQPGSSVRNKFKSKFWIGWNGQRFAAGCEARTLERHYPSQAKEIAERLSAHFGAPQ